MRHPFDLDPSELAALDLDFAEQLTDEEAAQVGGDFLFDSVIIFDFDPAITTEAVGEEGGITDALCEDRR